MITQRLTVHVLLTEFFYDGRWSILPPLAICLCNGTG